MLIVIKIWTHRVMRLQRLTGEVKLYRQGKAEACNNLGFCAFMRMDFEQAEKYYQEVYSLTKNELEL